MGWESVKDSDHLLSIFSAKMLLAQSSTICPLGDQRRYDSLDVTTCADCLLSTYLQPLLHDGEDPFHANAEPHTWHLAPFGVEHAHQPIIASSSSYTAHTQGLVPCSDWGL